MVVLYWSWSGASAATAGLRGRAGSPAGWPVKLASPVEVVNRRSSRGGWGSAPARLPYPGVEVLEAGDHAFDAVTDPVVVRLEVLPRHLGARFPEGRPCHTADDRHLAEQVLGGGFQPPRERCTMLMESSTVTNCGPAGRRSASVRPRQGRMSACSPAMTCEPFSSVEILYGDASAERLFGQVGVGGRGSEIAAQRDEDPYLAVAHGTDALHRVVAVVARGRERELGAECVQERVVWLLVDAHRPVALHVAATRVPGTGPLPDGRCRRGAEGSSRRPGWWAPSDGAG